MENTKQSCVIFFHVGQIKNVIILAILYTDFQFLTHIHILMNKVHTFSFRIFLNVKKKLFKLNQISNIEREIL